MKTEIRFHDRISVKPTRPMTHSSPPVIILYFAWLRDRLGTGREELSLPEGVTTVAGLITLLLHRGNPAVAGSQSDILVRLSQFDVGAASVITDSWSERFRTSL